MSGYHLCQVKKARHPYFIESISTNIFTIEELCFYLEKNIYLLDQTIINEKLLDWIGTLRAAGDSCLLIFWNTVYICLQDRVIFPQTFSDYGKYRETTPFLFPDRESLGRCLRFFKGKGGRS